MLRFSIHHRHSGGEILTLTHPCSAHTSSIVAIVTYSLLLGILYESEPTPAMLGCRRAVHTNKWTSGTVCRRIRELRDAIRWVNSVCDDYLDAYITPCSRPRTQALISPSPLLRPRPNPRPPRTHGMSYIHIVLQTSARTAPLWSLQHSWDLNSSCSYCACLERRRG